MKNRIKEYFKKPSNKTNAVRVSAVFNQLPSDQVLRIKKKELTELYKAGKNYARASFWYGFAIGFFLYLSIVSVVLLIINFTTSSS